MLKPKNIRKVAITSAAILGTGLIASVFIFDWFYRYNVQICKVAGEGTAPGTPFTFQIANWSNSTQVINAGPAPQGNCITRSYISWFNIGNVTVTESPDPDYVITDITVTPNLSANTIDLENRNVTLRARQGTRRVTFINSRKATVKLCKRAGKAVSVGTPFTFELSNGQNVTVPAGPAPHGYCKKVEGPIATGEEITISEINMPGYWTSSISTLPVDRELSQSLNEHSVTIEAGAGITEVFFENSAKTTGYLEICKTGNIAGDYDFTIEPGGLGPFTVSAGSCMPAIEVKAGAIEITEAPATDGSVFYGCSAYPMTHQLDCDTANRKSEVRVIPGGITEQTIATIENKI